MFRPKVVVLSLCATLCIALCNLVLATATDIPTLEAPRIQSYAGYTRFVQDVPSGVSFSVTPLGGTLRLYFQNATATDSNVAFKHTELSGYSVETLATLNDAPSTRITLVTPQGVSERSGYRFAALGPSEGKTGLRLVLDISGGFSDTAPLGPTPDWVWHSGLAGPGAFTVVLDAGHGGSDQGAMGSVIEKKVTLEIALKIRERLEQAGVRVLMTRETDTEYSTTKKIDLAKRSALADGQTAFVSMHANAITPRLANSTYGLEVYYFSPKSQSPIFPDAAPQPTQQEQPQSISNDNSLPEQITDATTTEQNNSASPPPSRSELSKDLAVRVMSNLLAQTAASCKGVRDSDFYVIKNTTVPAILVETGYITHPTEGPQFKNTNYLDRLAYGVSLGVLEYLDNTAMQN